MFVIDFSLHLRENNAFVGHVRISPDATELVALFGQKSYEREVAWWNLATGTFVASSHMPPRRRQGSAQPAFLPDLSRVVANGYAHPVEGDHVILVGPNHDWDDPSPSTYCISAVPRTDDEILLALAVSPDGRWLVTGVEGYRIEQPSLTVQEFQPGGGKRRSKLRSIPLPLDPDLEHPHEEYPLRLAFSPDGTRIAYASSTRGVVVLDFASGEEVVSMDISRLTDGAYRTATGLWFSPDGSRLLVQVSTRLGVFDFNTGKLIVKLKAGRYRDAAFTPDGKRLLTGGMDKLVRVWDTATWTEVARYDWKVGPIHSVTVSPDGAIAAAGGDKNRVVVWDLDG